MKHQKFYKNLHFLTIFFYILIEKYVGFMLELQLSINCELDNEKKNLIFLQGKTSFFIYFFMLFCGSRDQKCFSNFWVHFVVFLVFIVSCHSKFVCGKEWMKVTRGKVIKMKGKVSHQITGGKCLNFQLQSSESLDSSSRIFWWFV